MAAKSSNPGADTCPLEQQIEGRVFFGLYGLTVGEIRAIESENAPRAAS
jgi:hypothetical protein